MAYPKFKNKHIHEALYNPLDYIRYKGIKTKLPKKWIIIYQTSVLKYIRRKYKPKKISGIVSNNAKILVYKNIGFIWMSGIGSPHATTVFEELIALGGKVFLNIGLAGGLKEEGVFLCTKALRDEGTSYHYLPHGHFTYPDKQLTGELGRAMEQQGIKYSKAITWTIDAPYRETKAEIEHYRKKGIATVEMEASALFAVAKVRKVKIASAFTVSDVLLKKWKPKFHTINVKQTLNKLIDAAVNCLK